MKPQIHPLNRCGIPLASRIVSAATAIFCNGLVLGQPTFEVSYSLPTGAVTHVFGLGDVNGDQLLDLVIPFEGGVGTIAVWLGDGAGQFAPRDALSTPAVAYAPALGDFDRDGKVDFVVSNTTPGTVSLFKGNGDGTFQSAGSFPSGGVNPLVTLTTDVNADGKLDILVTNHVTDSMAVLLGNGDGTFLPAVPNPVGGDPFGLVEAHLNADSHVDVAVTNAGDNTVSVLLGTGGATFQQQAVIAVGRNPSGIVVADVGGDGKLDVIVANSDGQSNSVSVLKGNGNGTFQAHVEFSTGVFPNDVAVADFDGDGTLDIAASHSQGAADGVALLMNSGNGAFLSPIEVPANAGAAGLRAADLNGDGRPDLLTTLPENQTLSIRINTTTDYDRMFTSGFE